MKISNLAVIFPGIGYTVDKPLLYYSQRIAAESGYEIKLLGYSGFPRNVKGNRDKMLECHQIALIQVREMLAGIDWNIYGDVLFIGKSIGTTVAANFTAENPEVNCIRFILYTPHEETFSFPLGDSVVFTGTDDPWIGGSESRIPQLCRERGIPCFVTPRANHSLETGRPLEDIENLKLVMAETKRFIEGS